jgi:hypothetical protein
MGSLVVLTREVRMRLRKVLVHKRGNSEKVTSRATMGSSVVLARAV